MVPVDVDVESETDSRMTEEESRFYTCHVCGDNWLSVRQLDDEGQSQVTFVHQMGVSPVLKRIAHMQTHLVTNKQSVNHWEYFFDEDEVPEDEWHDRLSERPTYPKGHLYQLAVFILDHHTIKPTIAWSFFVCLNIAPLWNDRF